MKDISIDNKFQQEIYYVQLVSVHLNTQVPEG